MRIVTLNRETGREFCVHTTDRALPGESLWAMAHKFCARNALSWPEVVDAMSAGNVLDGAGRRRAARMDPRLTPAGEWLLGFAETIRCGANAIEQGTIVGLAGDLVKRMGVDLLSANNLRFCPQCVAGGHHSIACQFVFQKHCQIHNTPLADKCPACSRDIPLRLPCSYEDAFACPHCKTALWERRVSVNADPKVEQFARQQLESLKTRLRTWSGLGFEFGVKRRNKPNDVEGGAAWIMAHGTRMSHYLDQMAARQSFSIPASATSRRTPTPSKQGTVVYPDYIKSYYKAICRQIRKRVLKSETKHVQRLCLADHRDRRFIDERERYRISEAPNEAFAYVSWRMLWEILESPLKLLAGGSTTASTRNVQTGVRARDWEGPVAQQFMSQFGITWTSSLDPAVKDQFDGRIFAMACMATFNRVAELYSKAPRSVNASPWQDIELDRAACPMFILETGGSVAPRLHWFTTQSSLSAA